MLVKPSVLEPYFSDILDIVHNQLGEGYTSKSEMKHAIEYGHDRFISVAFPDLNSNPPCQVVHSPPPSVEPGKGADSLPEGVHKIPAAVTIGCPFDSSNLASHVNFPPNQYPPSLSNTSPVGILRGISIHDDASGKGIMNETVGHTVSVLEDEGCRVQCFLAWRGSGGVQFYDIFKSNGFSLRREFPDYWVQESIREGYKCPECGKPPCECSALLFVRVGKSLLGL